MKAETAAPPTGTSEPTLTLTLRDGSKVYLAARRTLKLLSTTQAALAGQQTPLPDEFWRTHLDLVPFRDAVSGSSTDGSRLHELIMALLQGPDMRETHYSDDQPRFDPLDVEEETRC